LAIEVKDGGTPSLTAAADVIVTLQVTGVNDKDPVFMALPSTILETGTLTIILTMWFYKWRMHITES
jgi:hypothetical protein